MRIILPMASTDVALVDSIIARLEGAARDEEKFASLLLLTRAMDASDEARLARVCHAVGTPFLGADQPE